MKSKRTMMVRFFFEIILNSWQFIIVTTRS